MTYDDDEGYDCLEDALYEERSYRSRGCTDRMCGAQDCGTCFPAGQRWFDCRFCDAAMQGWELSDENEPGEDTCVCDKCLENYDPESGELIDG